MPRTLKTFKQLSPASYEKAVPTSNRISLDLAGLNLSDEQLAAVRQQAVKAAMTAAGNVLKRGGLANLADSFSTFSTFSTFGSGASFEGPEVFATKDAGSLIERIVG